MPNFNTETVAGTTGQGTTTNDQGQAVTFTPGVNGAPNQNIANNTSGSSAGQQAYNAMANTTGSAPTPAEQAVTALKPGQNPNPVAPLTPAPPPTPTPPTAPDLSQKYQQGLSTAQNSGQTSPTTGGAASAAVQSSLPTPPPAPPPNPLTQVFSTDPTVQAAFQQIMDAQTQWMSSQNQQQTLTQQYQQMTADAGIPALNTELMNMKNVINGTEDDIRNEVTKAGGFATNSQVLALTDSRNKVLIQNYNNLLDTKQQAMDNINTMMQLSEQDRTNAQNQFSQQMGFDNQILQMAEQMQTNAQNSFTSTASTIGWNGVLQQAQASGDPTAVARVEQTMGWQPDTLQKMASAPPTLDEQYKKAEIANINSEIAARNTPSGGAQTITGKPQTASQSAANLYGDRLNQANLTIDALGNKFTFTTAKFPLPNFLKSGDRQAYEQAKTNFVTAVLRRESGAAISPTEFKTAEAQYFPQPGDKPAVLMQKATLRNNVINNFYKEANVLRPVLPGQIIESEGIQYKVGPDGQSLTKI